jgi:hypothetical protein
MRQRLTTQLAAARDVFLAVRATRRLIAVGLVAIGVLVIGAAVALARPQPHPLVLHLRFHKVVLEDGGRILAAGRYVFFDERYLASAAPSGQIGVVVDEQTGRRTALSLPAGCSSQAMIGGPWLMFPCSSYQSARWLDLYALASGRWRTVTIPQTPCYSPGGISSDCFETPIRLGAQWIEFLESDCYHCGETRNFMNIWSGEVRADPTSPTRIPDLNSPGLARHLCRPLQVPKDAEGGVPGYDEFALFGRYGVPYADSGEIPTPFDGRYVQRCGSRTRTGGGAIGNSHLLLFANPTQTNKIDGLFLSSGTRFRIPIPGAAAQPVFGNQDVGLSDRTLFLGTYHHSQYPSGTQTTIWEAKLPARSPTQQPTSR